MNGGAGDLAFGFDSPQGMMGGRGRGRHRSNRSGGGRHGPAGRMPMGPSRGEQSDYCQHFVDTGQRPQNFLRDAHLTDRYADYPNLKELVERKDSLVAERASPPFFMRADLKEVRLTPELFGTKFDVVLIDPPWEEYVRRSPGIGDGISWSWQDIRDLDIGSITDTPSFVFLWCGSAEGLDAGRHCLTKWGFRRAEDICWIKTNRDPSRKSTSTIRQDAQAVLQHTKEHCLMGIKGTVRRATDGHIIHSNIDTDIIVSEEMPFGSVRKPEEMYLIIERFCLGRRRLELFGEDHNIRNGWVTLGMGLSSSNLDPIAYSSHFLNANGTPHISTHGKPQPGMPHLLGTSEEIEMLRPRSPPGGGKG
ncbi:hypothetical protein WJX84_005090 [Apatococcus fuscideae]|uniref:Uncharacterized protein n=1 Tax=Apatococcus fuscideae TaxID=2026836 RepID=A0AAW1TFA5_9CHLO